MLVEATTYVGAVTAITYSPDYAYVIYGSGYSITIWSVEDCKYIKSIQVMQRSTVHGIRFHNDLICVFGQKELCIYHWSSLVETRAESPDVVYHKNGFPDWIWDICFLNKEDALDVIAIGTAHNTVIYWSTKEDKCIRSICGKERRILYSMSLLNINDDLLVASGTVFSEVLIWSVSNPSDTQSCKGHNGVLFKLRWNEDGRYLLSVGDDRSFILWKNEISGAPYTLKEEHTVASLVASGYRLFTRAFGHTARLWDCLFTPHCILTASEDCTVRFWTDRGACIAAFGGHKGKHVWCIAYDKKRSIAASGGNDGAVKTWDVAGIVESYTNAHLECALIPSMKNEREEVRTSKSECIRCLNVEEGGKHIMVASNKGFVWEYSIESREWREVVAPMESENISIVAISKRNDVLCKGNWEGKIEIVGLGNANQGKRNHLICSTLRISNLFLQEEGETTIHLFASSVDHCIYYYTIDRNTLQATFILQMQLLPKGVVSSLLFLKQYQSIVIGDSVGSIHFYHIQEREGTITAELKRTIKKTHNYQPVTTLCYRDGLLYSAGHDAKILPIFVDWLQYSYELDSVIAVREIKQISAIWWTQQSELCVGGFHDDSFQVIDCTNAYEVLNVQCGGWKRPWSSSFDVGHPSYHAVFVFATPNGHSSITLFERKMKNRKIIPALAVPSHGREINCVHWIGMGRTGGWLATGGEDRILQFVRVEKCGGSIICKTESRYSVHTSSIRCITSMKKMNGAGFLCVSCGGRNTLCVWDLDEYSGKSQLTCCLPHRDSNNAIEGGDQRIMCCSTLKDVHAESSHFIATGDSSGSVSIYQYDENTAMCSLLYRQNHDSTPILSIRCVDYHEQHLLVLGAASGSIYIIHCASILQPRSTPFEWAELPHVHEMGINGLDAVVEADQIAIYTVGDDQSLRYRSIQITSFSPLTLSVLETVDKIGVSSTSLRSLSVQPSGVYFTGWEQRIFRFRREKGDVVYVDEIGSKVPETASLSVVEEEGSVYMAVCGAMGYEVSRVLIGL